MKGDTGENLIGLLERRLDTVVYRAKFVATMFAARQFINHGHVKVNGRRVNISSYKLKVGDLDRGQGILQATRRGAGSQPASPSATCPISSKSITAR